MAIDPKTIQEVLDRLNERKALRETITNNAKTLNIDPLEYAVMMIVSLTERRRVRTKQPQRAVERE